MVFRELSIDFSPRWHEKNPDIPNFSALQVHYKFSLDSSCLSTCNTNTWHKGLAAEVGASSASGKETHGFRLVFESL